MEKACKANNFHYNKSLKHRANFLRNNATKSEACLWKYVLNASQLGYSFKRQRPVLNYIADFLSTELMLIIEVETTVERDRIKQQELEKIGFTVLRFTDDEVLSAINSVRESIISWIEGQVEIPPPNPRQRGKRKKPIIVPNYSPNETA